MHFNWKLTSSEGSEVLLWSEDSDIEELSDWNIKDYENRFCTLKVNTKFLEIKLSITYRVGCMLNHLHSHFMQDLCEGKIFTP